MLWWILLPVIWVAILAYLFYSFAKSSSWVLAGPLAVAPFREKTPLQIHMRKIVPVFLTALAFRVFMLFIMWLAAQFVGENGNALPMREVFLRWDATHYVKLVEKGYGRYHEYGKTIFLVFFPLYVWIVRFLKLLIPDTLVAGWLVSSLSYAAGCVYVYLMTEHLYSKQTARRAVLYLSIFPFSFFFGSVMTEGLFLLTTAASLYYTARHRWFAAGIWGALAAATRMTGLLTGIAIAVEYMEASKPLRLHYEKSWWRPWLARFSTCLLPIAGTLVYLLLNWNITGNPFAFVEYQKHWFQGSQWLPDTIKLLIRNTYEYRHTSFGAAIWLPEVILFFAFLTLLITAVFRRKHKNFLLFYALAYLTMTYSLSWLLSAGRYLSASIVFFVFAAELTEKNPWLDKVLTVSSAILMGVFLFAYVLGAEIM